MTGAAQRRKQRRLRSWWRHEQQSIAAALATSLHHSSRGQRKARAGEEESETKYRTTPPPPQPVLFSLYDEEPGGRRPASLAEPPRPQERVQRHTVEHITDLPWCRSSMLLCRRRWTSCMTCSSSSTGSRPFPIRLSKCPRSTPRTSLCARFCVLRSWQNTWWKCRRSFPMLPCC